MQAIYLLTMKNFFFDLLALGALLSSVLVITSKNPVIAVVFLISVFINAAGYLILLGVGFIGISYIIVYIGAITVLFLFVIMMINIRLTDIIESGSQYTKNIPLALAIGSVFIYELFTILPFTINNVSSISTLLETLTNFNTFFSGSNLFISNEVNTAFNPVIADISFSNFLQIEAIAHLLYSIQGLWLILTTMILLLSIVAPIFISKK
jgi:NADH-ubiquinone oxidoreductase chain 6